MANDFVDKNGSPELLKSWALVCACAWINPTEVLKPLRKDPKTTIDQMAEGQLGAPENVQIAAQKIQATAINPTVEYSGYLPIPGPEGDGLQNLQKEEITKLIGRGIMGIMNFNLTASVWSEIFYDTWHNRDNLIAIRKDPHAGLRKVLSADQFNELRDSLYGILPIPDLPTSLEGLDLDPLADLYEQWDYPMGIFPTYS